MTDRNNELKHRFNAREPDSGAGKSFGLMFQRGNFLRIVTVVIVVLAALFLALAGKPNDGAAALLSGIAGISLGGLERTPPSSANDKTSNS